MRLVKAITKFFQHPPRPVAIGPFQFVLMVVAILQGITLLLNSGHATGILNETYPTPMVILWGVSLCAGGVLAIIGRVRKTGWREESAGLAIVATTLLLFFVTVLAIHPDAAPANLVDLGYVYACHVRIRVLRIANEAETAIKRGETP